MSFLDDLQKQFITVVGHINVQTRPPHTRASHCRKAMELARPGMAICRKYSFYLDTLLIPGEFSHSGIIETDGSVVHAMGGGVERADILDFVKDTDGFCMTYPRVPYYKPEDAVAFAVSKIGKPYDFKFVVDHTTSAKIEAFFCHELTANALGAGNVTIVPKLEVFSDIFAKEVFLADQFISDERFETVYRTEF